MIHPQKFIHRIAPDGLTHPWHISETSELFASLSVRMIGMSMVGVFVPTLLYLNGFSLEQISLYYIVMACVRFVTIFWAVHLIARFGPKHILAFSYLLTLIFFAALIGVERYSFHWLIPAIINGVYLAAYFTAYNVDLTKVTSGERSGSQIGVMNSLIKLSAAAGPLISGFIAVRYGITTSLIVAFAFVAVAALPLFLTPEATQRPLVVSYQGMLARRFWRDYVSTIAMTVNTITAGFVWPLFLTVVVISDSGYDSLGIISSASFMIAVILSPIAGKVIDRVNSQKHLITAGSATSAVSHALRIAASSISLATIIGSIFEFFGLFLRLAFMKGFFAEVNLNKGQRIATVAMYELASTVSYILVWAVFLLILSFDMTDRMSFSLLFAFGAIVTSLVAVQNFRGASE